MPEDKSGVLINEVAPLLPANDVLQEGDILLEVRDDDDGDGGGGGGEEDVCVYMYA